MAWPKYHRTLVSKCTFFNLGGPTIECKIINLNVAIFKVNFFFSSITLPCWSHPFQLLCIILSWDSLILNLWIILNWLHCSTVTISGKVSDFHQIRLKLFLSASVPSTHPDNKRSTENIMELIILSNAQKLLALVFTWNGSKVKSLAKSLYWFCGGICFSKVRWVRHIQGFVCQGPGIYRITARSHS